MNNENIVKKAIDRIDTITYPGFSGIDCFWVFECELCKNFISTNNSHGSFNYCPWNSEVLYGCKSTCKKQCKPKCELQKVRFLPSEERKKILLKFKNQLETGKFKPNGPKLPLISSQQKVIIKEKRAEELNRKKRAKEWLAKYSKYYTDKKYIKYLILEHYLKNDFRHNEEGFIFFSPDEMKNVVGAENMSYDEYIHIQLQNYSKRFDFIMCYINIPCEFKGKIQKINSKQICFERVYVDGMYLDDASFFEGKEDHVWMSKDGFEDFQVGDSVSFHADVYRYLKKGNGKSIEFGLRNPSSIKKIEAYKLPTDRELIEKEVQRTICETCYLYDHCNGYCMRDIKEIKALRKQRTDEILSIKKNYP